MASDNGFGSYSGIVDDKRLFFPTTRYRYCDGLKFNETEDKSPINPYHRLY